MKAKKEALTAVRVVCRGRLLVAALPHVAHEIDAFLFEEDTSQWTLESASERGFARLLDRLLQYQWPRYSYYFRGQRLKKGIKSAVMKGYDVRVLDWWVKCYVPDQTEYGLDFVLELGIASAQFLVLEWIHQETQGRLPPLTRTVSCCNAEVIYWLYEHGGRHLSVKLWLQSCPADARYAFIKWCIERGGECNAYFGAPRDALKIATEHSLETLQQLLELWPELCTPDSLNVLVEQGNFEAIKWLYESRSEHYFSDVRLHSTRFNTNLEAIRWLVFDVVWRNQDARFAWINSAIRFAVCSGEFDMLESINSIRQQIIMTDSVEGPVDSLSELNLIGEAVGRGYLEIAQWLLDHGSPCCSTMAMDDAAATGNLESVKWLVENQNQVFTTNAMDNAAGSGHLEMVQWLHTNRSEGCTSNAMDNAALYGRMEVIKWLHGNRNEGCTTNAMNRAASQGHLEVIQWLHENRTEGCTIHAMDSAASNGHVNVLQFLHTHRTEGCTANAMTDAALNGQLKAFKWLHENRSEGCSEEALDSFHSDNLEFMALSTNYFSLDRTVDALAIHGHFGMIDLILRQTRAKELAFALSVYVDL